MTDAPQENRFDLPPSIYVLAAVVLWSTGGLFIKWTSLPAFEVNAGRCFLAALVVGLLTYKKGLRLNWWTLLTSLLYAGTLACFAIATKKTTSANAIFLQYTAPIYILLLAPFVLKEKFKWTDLVTVAVCLAGMSLFFLDAAPNANLSPQSQFEGNLYALASGVFFGLYFTLLRHPRSLRLNPAVSVFWGNIISAAAMVYFFTTDLFEWSAQDFIAVGFLGIFQIGLAYYLFTVGIAKGVRSLDASIIGFIEPLLNPVWVFLLLGERPANWAIIGGAVIITAVAAHTLFNSGRAKAIAQ